MNATASADILYRDAPAKHAPMSATTSDLEGSWEEVCGTVNGWEASLMVEGDVCSDDYSDFRSDVVHGVPVPVQSLRVQLCVDG